MDVFEQPEQKRAINSSNCEGELIDMVPKYSTQVYRIKSCSSVVLFALNRFKRLRTNRTTV